jgi:TolB-like protein
MRRAGSGDAGEAISLLAVLALENTSSAPDVEYLRDGIVESLISNFLIS